MKYIVSTPGVQRTVELPTAPTSAQVLDGLRREGFIATGRRNITFGVYHMKVFIQVMDFRKISPIQPIILRLAELD